MIEKEIVLTEAGKRKIEDELDHLEKVHRRQVADRIRESKQFGEFSENSEYEDAKMEQAFVEGRIIELKRVLNHAVIVETNEVPTDRVGVGTIVRLHDVKFDEDWEITIVGSVEADPDQDRISLESPMGEALVGKAVGDIVNVRTPSGSFQYEIRDIRRA
ncbi:MAG: transcription elongation factor GreA [Armatimonadetes bacterium]|nr:transcription elongation factor GreA [Armatimonadota bacterium]